MCAKWVRITHRRSGEVLAEGKLGWKDIMSFEGNYYVAGKHLRTENFKTSYLPGVCVYKFFYIWLDYTHDDVVTKHLGWRYVLPNPLLPFIWFRVALPQTHPDLEISLNEERRVHYDCP